MNLDVTHASAQTPCVQGLARLMRRAFAGEDLSAEAQALLQRAHSGDAEAMYDLAIVLQLRGDRDTGVALQGEALQMQQLYRLQTPAPKSPLRVLALMAPGDLMSNIPLEFIAEGAGFALELLYLSPELPRPLKLPPHDVAILALSELDRNRANLEQLRPLFDKWPRPILNNPAALLRMGRAEISSRLQGLAGLDVPLTRALGREQLLQLAAEPRQLDQYLADGQWPLIIRPIDSHAGQGLACVRDGKELAQYCHAAAEDAFFISRFVNYASDDGQFRKYRIMLIDGEPQLAHMAISDHWMVHYLNAGMVESEAKRQEEARTMANFDRGFARRHRRALAAIGEVAGLDYLGIDCGESADGRLLVFEVGAAMNVHAMDPADIFPYKQPQMQRLFTAFESMLLRRHLDYRIAKRRAGAPFGEPPRGEPGQQARRA